MNSNDNPKVAIVIPVGPGKETALDTLDSVEVFCPEPHAVFVVDDHTKDGTYEALCEAKRPHWEIMRNEQPYGVHRLVHGQCAAYEQVLLRTKCELVLRLDQDALLIKPGVLSEAISFMRKHPRAGMFGVYVVDYDRPRSYASHKRRIDRETAGYRALIGRRPSWKRYLDIAEQKGYRRGDHVFGGAYFITRECILALRNIGALNLPWSWHSILSEDVYFSMLTVAAGLRLCHFAAPDGPLCLEWRGLPFPAAALASSKYKLVHSVDKGKNTGPGENGGRTAREVFRDLRAEAAPCIASAMLEN